jgi:oligopeptide/dipeptide ABC transporter ATP-binding protein
MREPLLQATDLVKEYPRRKGGEGRGRVRAVDGVSLGIQPGEVLGLVGESGCGKSTLGRLVTGLEPPTSGAVTFAGHPVQAGDRRAMFPLRRRLQIVFQDPYGSLNPRLSVGAAVAEGLAIHGLARRAEVPERVGRLLAEVGLDPRDAGRYPHEFSGGQRQRIGIARALAVEPELVVCDEPVSALDVSVQAQVLNLLADLRHNRGLALLFIAHDLAVVRQVAQRIAVMYLGRLVEVGPASTIVSAPRHPYAQALLSAVPSPDPDRPNTRIVLAGDPPSPTVPMPGCAFVTRCFHPHRDTRCQAERPSLRAVGGHQVACHYAEES